MNVCELIEAVGIDNVEVQFLDSCADDMRWSEKSGITKVKFGTNVGLTPDGLKMHGMVVWMPREAVDKAVEDAKGAQS